MAGQQSAPRRAGVLDNINDWMAQRNADVHQLAREAEAAGREAWEKATRTGQSVAAMRPGDVSALGAKMLKGGVQSQPSPQARPRTRSSPAASGQESRGLLDYGKKVATGMVARPAGAVVGAARGVRHTAQDLVESVNFASRLLDPLDAQYSPRGEAAWDQVANAGGRAFEYVKNVVSDPGAVVDDVDHALHKLRVDINPSATPMAATIGGEFRRNYEIGKNQGEFAVDVGAMVLGGRAIKKLAGLGPLSKEAQIAKFMEQGFNPAQARYLAEPYIGKGHHNVAQASKIPATIKGVPIPNALVGFRLPRAISDSSFNVLKPSGISRGDFYELHYKVDPHFWNANLPAREGGGRWTGSRLGLKKYGGLGRAWHGAPGPLKAVSGVGGLQAGGLIHDQLDEENPR